MKDGDHVWIRIGDGWFGGFVDKIRSKSVRVVMPPDVFKSVPHIDIRPRNLSLNGEDRPKKGYS